jgi:hypothetical protein
MKIQMTHTLLLGETRFEAGSLQSKLTADERAFILSHGFGHEVDEKASKKSEAAAAAKAEAEAASAEDEAAASQGVS